MNQDEKLASLARRTACGSLRSSIAGLLDDPRLMLEQRMNELLAVQWTSKVLRVKLKKLMQPKPKVSEGGAASGDSEPSPEESPEESSEEEPSQSENRGEICIRNRCRLKTTSTRLQCCDRLGMTNLLLCGLHGWPFVLFP